MKWLLLGGFAFSLAVSACGPTVSEECLNRMSDCVRRCAPNQQPSDQTPMPVGWFDQRQACERQCMELCGGEAPAPETPLPNPEEFLDTK